MSIPQRLTKQLPQRPTQQLAKQLAQQSNGSLADLLAKTLTIYAATYLDLLGFWILVFLEIFRKLPSLLSHVYDSEKVITIYLKIWTRA